MGRLLLHYGTLSDCLVLAGKEFLKSYVRVNQDILRAADTLPQADALPWEVIEALVFCAPTLLEEASLMEYDTTKGKGDCASIYIESLSMDVPAITIYKPGESS
jgi:hypothetical protein